MTDGTGLSVSELNLMIAESIRRDPRTRSVLVRGEVSGFRNQIASGHWYFSLKDAQASIPCAMFRNANLKAQIRPKDGDLVLIPREGRERFLFGAPTRVPEKFRLMAAYYESVAPAKEPGWYSLVDVRHRKQLVCRK